MIFKVGIGNSQENTPIIAAKNVIEKAVEELGVMPTFVLFFSTIHYKDNNGFQQMLDTIYQSIPKSTPLIGGTVAGFMNREGEFSKGVTLLACYSDFITVKAAIGRNTKNNPKRSVSNIFNTLDSNTENSIIEFTSGPLRPKMPIIGDKFVVKSKILSKVLLSLMEFSTVNLQKGFGREEEVLEEISRRSPKSNIVGGSTCDDNHVISAFEFFYDTVNTNSTVALQLGNIKTKLSSIHGYQSTNKLYTVTKMSSRGRIINEIDGEPAVQKYCEITSIPYDNLDESLHRKTFFIPFGFTDSVGFTCPMAVGGILGQSFYFSHGVKGNKIELLTSSGNKLEKEANRVVDDLTKLDIFFMFGIGCVSWIETLGRKIAIINNQFKKINSNYFVVFTMGEDFYTPDTTDRHTNESFNTLVFLKN